jgi:hypothetical protein
MNCKISSDGTTCVDYSYYWQPLDTAPHGVKVQMLSKYGVAAYGTLSPSTIADGFWVMWAPLPKLKKEDQWHSY